MKQPTGEQILSLLIDLLAKQERVTVQYEIAQVTDEEYAARAARAKTLRKVCQKQH